MAHTEAQNGGGAAPPVVFTAAKPQLMVDAPRASDAVAFYKAAFGAEELGRSFHPKRKADQEAPLVLSSQIVLAGLAILVSDNADAPFPAAEPETKGTKSAIVLETEEVDLAVANAVKAGAILEGGEVAETDGGVRAEKVVVDPFGFTWIISAPVKKSAEVEEA
ncbi:hypothetical protein MLD38_028241 [Melastoma candidum]|uniref:Uncharacterized protein n=1 Tax=Melastoma candidum TaxID=119954 RepID=A0ACB9N0G2_9MYRT|nr:hypothetical protein MLD38_028241 [Melastoma candidum]